ncbi:type 4 pilus major pilin [Trinickia fusca]|uniref:Pilus assembly protein n=1 Tax=Trinickia fusca TaxID=2419777 RepID=A0A494X4I3_9BURK|nr:type 4 pilus major pilin [Trinickia fusca]RKP44591.1 pilus assembly protein [Trinickia fusca]
MKTRQHQPLRRLQKGASLLEGIAYLGIAAIVVIGAIALLNSAFSSANSNQLNSELSAEQTASRKLFMTTQGNYGGADFTTALASAKGFPQSLTVDTKGDVTNAWGGSVTVAGNATTAGQFAITYTAVPEDVCINSLTSTTEGWLGVAVGGNAAIQPPITPVQAKKACAATNTIIWTSN